MRLVRRQIQALHSGGWWEEDDNGHKLKQGKFRLDIQITFGKCQILQQVDHRGSALPILGHFQDTTK